jgi:4-amino-4-deoxy-L-arabinose transferase-like glycosyltransferase
VKPAEVAEERPPEPALSRRMHAALTLGFFALLIAQASIAPLQETDEGRSAAIAWETLHSGDWVTPHLNGIRYYEKPPLYFWLVAAAMGVVGQTDLAVRLPSLLASFLTVLLVARWGTRMRGPRTGLLAASILASMFLFAFMARVAQVDPLLTLCITFSLYSADRFLLEPDRAARWTFGFWGALGLATLVKGPVGIVLPLAPLIVFLLWTRDWTGLGSLFRPSGLVLFLLICCPWYIAMSRRNPDYLAEFLLGQNLDRLIEGSRFNRDKPFWYYLPVLLLGFLPWSFYFLQASKRIREAFRNRARPESRRTLFLASAVLLPFLILSFAHSKLTHYILPLCPLGALLLAEALSLEWERPRDAGTPGRFGAGHLRIFGALLIAFAALALVPVGMDPEILSKRLGFEAIGPGHEMDLVRIRIYQTPLPGAAAILCALGISAIWAGGRIRRDRPQTAVLGLTAAVLLGIVGAQFLVAPMGPAMSSRALAGKTARHLTGDAPVVLYRRHLRGLTYYLKKPVILWEVLYNEFGHEVGTEEAAPVTVGGRIEALIQLLKQRPETLLIVESSWRLQDLRTFSSMEFDELDREGDFLIVRVRRSR